MEDDNQNIAYLEESKSLLTYKSKRRLSLQLAGNTGTTITSSIDSSFSYAKYFDNSKNKEPELILKLIQNNNITPAILATKAKFVVGNGIVLFEEEVTEGKTSVKMVDYPDVLAELKRLDINEHLYRMALDLEYFGNSYIEFIPNIMHNKILLIGHQDATLVRAGKKTEEDKIPHFFLCGNWKKPVYDETGKTGNVIKVKGYNASRGADWRGELGDKFMYQAREYTPGFPYYSIPSWYGSAKWIELANVIPNWHLSGIKNGYNLRYFVEISEAVLAKIPMEKRAEVKEKIQDELDARLAGEENVGKAIFNFMEHSIFNEKGVLRITPMQAALNDDAFNVLFGSSNQAITSGMAIDPSLCGIETQGKLSSGGEKRIAYEMWLRSQAPRPRAILLKVLQIISEYNGWDKIYPKLQFGFKNVELVTLDKNPTGNQNSMVN
jgi:hypothetical protein